MRRHLPRSARHAGKAGSRTGVELDARLAGVTGSKAPHSVHVISSSKLLRRPCLLKTRVKLLESAGAGAHTYSIRFLSYLAHSWMPDVTEPRDR